MKSNKVIRRPAKAQTILVYAAVAALLIAAVSVLSFYFRRSLQGKYRESIDVFGDGVQYEPEG